MRFLLELCALVALCYWGLQTTDGFLRFVLAVLAPAMMAVLWGAFVAPKAPRRMEDRVRVALELVIFGAAAIGLALAVSPTIGLLLAAAAVVNIGLMFLFHQRGL